MKRWGIWLWLLCICAGAAAFEIDLKTAQLRNAKGKISLPEVRTSKTSRSAEVCFDLGAPGDLARINCAKLEITPLEGRFSRRDLAFKFYSGKKEAARFHPKYAPAKKILKNGERTVLEYEFDRKLENITGVSFLFNREIQEKAGKAFLLHSLTFSKRFVPRRSGSSSFHYKVNTPVCALLAPDDRGLTPEEARYADFGKRTFPRPAPIAKLPWDDTVSGRGSVEKESVSLELLNESGEARDVLLRFGVPFSRGKVFGLDRLRLLSAKGEPVPAQFSALSRYDDKSLRHLFVTARTRLAGNEKTHFTLEFGNAVKAPPVREGLSWTFKDGVLAVDAGRLKGTVRQKGFNFVDDITLDGRRCGRFLPAEIVLADGSRFTPADPDSFELIEAGPLRLTLRAAGKYTGNAGSYVARIAFAYGRPGFDVDFTHIDSVLEMEFTDFKSLSLVFAPADPLKKQFRAFQETERDFSLDGGPRQKGKLSGAFNFTPSFGIALADWHRRYPKAVTAKEGKVFIELLPLQPGKDFNADLPLKLSYVYSDGNYRMKWGMSFTERITFDFGGTSEKVLAADRDLPVIAVLPFDYYRKEGFAPDDGGLAPVDASFTEAFGRYLARQEKEREFGFFNYGDSFGERGHSWTNNEYDPAQAVAEAFLRTGNREMLRYAVSAARHQADVDTCHAYPNAFFVGANLQHAVGHSGVGREWSHAYTHFTTAGNGHSWTRGRLLVWLLAADPVVMDSTLMFGEHCVFGAIPNYKGIVARARAREAGWMLRALTALYEVTGDPAYFKGAKTLADMAVRECAYDKGAWPAINSRLRDGYGIKTLGNNCFQVSILIQGLCDYYRMTGDRDVKRALVSAARWLAKGFNPGNGAGFNYDIAADGTGLNWPVSMTNPLLAPPLAGAAVIADDPALFAAAQRAMARVLLAPHAVDHKHFGLEFTFLAEYLRAEAEWNKKHGLKSDYGEEALRRKLYDGAVPEWRVRGSSRWHLVSTADDAKILLRRWIRSGMPKKEAKFVLRDEAGKILLAKTVRPDILRQDIPLVLPGKRGSRFFLEFADEFGGDWSLDGSSQAVYAVFMSSAGLPVSHMGLRRFYFRVPAGKKVVVSYAGNHVGLWRLRLNDGGTIHVENGKADDIQLKKFRDGAAVVALPVQDKDRLVEMECFAAIDGRILLRGADRISADRRYFESGSAR
ncbi:MAG: hypothetical protein IJS01_04620 [Lentisphaeria bacterium]|nr:hypothetical protein [Lentisphaeria bacterium]